MFGSKRGIVQALMERTAFSAGYEKLVRGAVKSDDPETRLRFAARIARQIFDSVKKEAEVLRGATAVAPEFVRAKESIRFERQAPLAKPLEKKEALRPDVTPSAARDILWALTGRDLYRIPVIERGWSGDRYEEWLGNTLIAALLKPKS